MSRGEAINDISDVFRIKTLCEATPDTVWWVPTRAWRNKGLKELIEDVFVWAMKEPNRKVKDREYEITKDIYDYWK